MRLGDEFSFPVPFTEHGGSPVGKHAQGQHFGSAIEIDEKSITMLIDFLQTARQFPQARICAPSCLQESRRQLRACRPQSDVRCDFRRLLVWPHRRPALLRCQCLFRLLAHDGRIHAPRLVLESLQRSIAIAGTLEAQVMKVEFFRRHLARSTASARNAAKIFMLAIDDSQLER